MQKVTKGIIGCIVMLIVGIMLNGCGGDGDDHDRAACVVCETGALGDSDTPQGTFL